MAVVVVGAIAAFGLWLEHVIPDKPPAVVEAILGIPDSVKEGIHNLTSGRALNGPPSITSYKNHAEEIRAKYKIL